MSFLISVFVLKSISSDIMLTILLLSIYVFIFKVHLLERIQVSLVLFILAIFAFKLNGLIHRYLNST